MGSGVFEIQKFRPAPAMRPSDGANLFQSMPLLQRGCVLSEPFQPSKESLVGTRPRRETDGDQPEADT
jgi:hypothetical protein